MRRAVTIGLFAVAMAIASPMAAQAQVYTGDRDSVLQNTPPASRGQGPGYGEAPSYGNSNPTYGESNPTYGEAPTYGDAPTYGQSNPSYGQSNPGYGQSNPSYGQAPTYGQATGYGQPSGR